MRDREVCFFCRARPAEPEAAATVRVQRRTARPGGELIEGRDVSVPRCEVCLRAELLRWVMTGAILVVLLVVAVVTWDAPRWAFGISMTAVFVGGLAAYSAWRNRRGIKRSMGDVREYPEVTDLIRDGYRVLKSGPGEVFSRVFGRGES
jgi:hypothetical protein